MLVDGVGVHLNWLMVSRVAEPHDKLGNGQRWRSNATIERRQEQLATAHLARKFSRTMQ
jgi:hypothetical protein